MLQPLIFLHLLLLLLCLLQWHPLMADPVPVVLWHGMGDSCCNPMSMGYIRKLIRTHVPGGIYVRSLRLGATITEDIEHGFLANMNEEVANVCAELAKDPKLANGYNAIGFSQGGLFVRALAQRCAGPPIRNLISIGGPQQGVFGFPYCPGSAALCKTVRHMLDHGAYLGIVQHTVVQAQYWHDPTPSAEYARHNFFLADLNCEPPRECPPDYRLRVTRLRALVLVQFLRDHMLEPKETAWFGFYADNDTSTMVPMERSELYTEDRIGLKTLNELGRLHLLAIDGQHLQIPKEVFISEIIQKYLMEDNNRDDDDTDQERNMIDEDQ